MVCLIMSFSLLRRTPPPPPLPLSPPGSGGCMIPPPLSYSFSRKHTTLHKLWYALYIAYILLQSNDSKCCNYVTLFSQENEVTGSTNKKHIRKTKIWKIVNAKNLFIYFIIPICVLHRSGWTKLNWLHVVSGHFCSWSLFYPKELLTGLSWRWVPHTTCCSHITPPCGNSHLILSGNLDLPFLL